jgi:hypothetical protein
MNNGLGALRTDPDDEFLEVPSLSLPPLPTQPSAFKFDSYRLWDVA